MNIDWMQILIYFLYFIVLWLGVLSHFLKKKILGETFADIKQYFSSHFKNTLVTCISAIVLYASLIATGGLSVVGVFTAGYTVDSLCNKSDGDVIPDPNNPGKLKILGSEEDEDNG